MSTNIKLLIVDDHQMIREGLKSLLERETGFSVVGEAEDGRQAMDLAARRMPSVVVMDVSMPGLNGIDTTRHLLRAQPTLKVVALSGHGDRNYVSEMLKAGASAYVLKHSAYEELARAIREVMAGRTYLSPEVTREVVDGFVRSTPGAEKPSVFAALTPREREALQRMAEGKSTKEIAAAMKISIKTVQTYRLNMMAKLNLNGLAELTKYAIREGITSLD